MANDQLQESWLKDILKSQQFNSADIKINHNLIRQMTKDLAQVNVTLTEITQHTEILFTLAIGKEIPEPQTVTLKKRTDTPPAIEAPRDAPEPQTSWKAPVVPATPDSVAEALQNTTGINFERYYKKKRQRAAAVKTYQL